MNMKKYYRLSFDPEKEKDVIEYLEEIPRILRSEGVTAAIRFLLENMDSYTSNTKPGIAKRTRKDPQRPDETQYDPMGPKRTCYKRPYSNLLMQKRPDETTR
jgi:hypothetical protein